MTRNEIELEKEESSANILLADAAGDMAMDLAEDKVPHARQLLLVADGGTATPSSAGPAGVARGGGPDKIVLPVDGSVVVLGRGGAAGFIDPYMSAQQVELACATEGEMPSVTVRAIGRNGCRARQSAVSDDWVELKQGSFRFEMSLTEGGQLSMLHDGSWTYRVVAVGAKGKGRLTRKMSE